MKSIICSWKKVIDKIFKYTQLSCDKGAKAMQWKKDNFKEWRQNNETFTGSVVGQAKK